MRPHARMTGAVVAIRSLPVTVKLLTTTAPLNDLPITFLFMKCSLPYLYEHLI